MRRKAADLDALWRVCRSPPGSESRACIHRGSSGTGESQLSPCTMSVRECPFRIGKTPGAEEDSSSPSSESASVGKTNKEERYKVSGKADGVKSALKADGVKSALDSCGVKCYRLSHGTSTQNRVSWRLVPCDEPGKKSRKNIS